MIPLLGIMVGGLLGWRVGEGVRVRGLGVYTWLYGGGHYNSVMTREISGRVMRASYRGLYKGIDRGILEGVGPYGVRGLMRGLMGVVIGMQGGRVYNYIGVMVVYVGLML